MSHRLSPFENPAGRQSPFRRQNSASQATMRAATPSSSPTKTSSSLSPTKPTSLSPEKTSPFVRRPSQISQSSERPSSPLARPTSSLSIPASPSRVRSNVDHTEELRNSSRLSFATPPPMQPSMELDRGESEEPDTPTVAPPSPSPRFDGASSSSEMRVPKDSLNSNPPSPANLRPAAHPTATSSTTSIIKPPVFTSQPKTSATAPPKINSFGGGAYNHIPQPLLHSMRESFEALDSNNTGTVNSAAVSEMLSQLGLDNTTASLKDFFPPNAPTQLNLPRYLDTLSGPLADLSQPEELRAAFEAFDVDDSGQIDLSTLRDALMHTAKQPGEDMIRLSERELDGILGEFTGRRTFGSKGMHISQARGEVFRYRDFMASVSGGGTNMNGAEATMAT